MTVNNISNINYLVIVPLIVMSYHVYEFFSTEPLLIRISLAISFDLLVVAVFYLLKDDYIARTKSARQMTWAALYTLIGFQLYVNVWAYSDLHWLRAGISGSIFPAVVGLISYISVMRESKAEKVQQKKQKQKKQQKALEEAGSVIEVSWSGKLVKKEHVRDAYKKGLSVETFSGCRNLKSVKRWMNKLKDGEEL